MNGPAPHPSEATLSLLEEVELRRQQTTRALDPKERSALGQFFTPLSVARDMARLFSPLPAHIRVLEAGAGVGSLLSALLEEGVDRGKPLASFEVDAYEVDPQVAEQLKLTLSACSSFAAGHGVSFEGRVHQGDFIDHAARILDGGLFREKAVRFTHAILNPPYKKLNSSSDARLTLRRLGIETSNLYTAFIALAVQLLEPGGELVAITPRSFCNGPYFRPFREMFLASMDIQRFHLFTSRRTAFAGDDVLQENVIFHARKGRQGPTVVVSSSAGPGEEATLRDVPFEHLVRPEDPERFIHLVPDELDQQVAHLFARFTSTLSDLGVEVSTGKVVDFRAKDYLRDQPGKDTGPLLYPTHLEKGTVTWPKAGKKANALVDCPETSSLWMPSGTYVLVKRMSSKEEARRVVATVVDPAVLPAPRLGFENHLNVFHTRGAGLEPALAQGLAAFLNSRVVDTFFRQFSGHTQVNATDLRNLRYPAPALLRQLGEKARGLTAEAIEPLVENLMTTGDDQVTNPFQAQKKIDEALFILKALDLPRAQQNERSALTLLALLGLAPAAPWNSATAPLIGITPVMEFAKDLYGKSYAPNTRETFRRQTMHQFLDAALVLQNPDEPGRPTNSPHQVYQIAPAALDLLRTFGTSTWSKSLADYLDRVGTLKAKYQQQRQMARLPVTLPDGTEVTLSPGGQNPLVKEILEQFCPRYTPGAFVIYVGDTEEKAGPIFKKDALAALGVTLDMHGKMPDVVVHDVKRNWLLLIEAVTSHGPVNPKRHQELADLFKDSTAGLVYVTAFLSRESMMKYLADISWETEVWVADAPDHMIHFNGVRFLGPYKPAPEG